MPRRKNVTNLTLCFLIRSNGYEEVCLALKANSVKNIGVGYWNGFGGEEENGEGIRTAAVRELEAESTVEANPADLIKMAELNIVRKGKRFKGHVFVLKKWKGKPQSTSEMVDPQWFPVEALPLNSMMPADEYWLPPIFEGWEMHAEIVYGKYEQLKSCSISYGKRIIV